MIIFDTETTGLIKSVDLPLRVQPHIIEFAAVKADENFEEIGCDSFLVRPPVKIDEEVEKITGISGEDVKNELPLVSLFGRIQALFFGEELVVGHNVTFDIDMLHIEARRLGLETSMPWPPRRMCTVEMAEAKFGRRMNLSDLHERLFGEPFKGAHRALADVRATLRCFKALKG